ncbi:MAG: hypothetical protein FWG10_05355 [Eubacteriaceae bacterium]|nr:hypothetical protein [Eubacteriaceae bacterium]
MVYIEREIKEAQDNPVYDCLSYTYKICFQITQKKWASEEVTEAILSKFKKELMGVNDEVKPLLLRKICREAIKLSLKYINIDIESLPAYERSRIITPRGNGFFIDEIPEEYKLLAESHYVENQPVSVYSAQNGLSLRKGRKQLAKLRKAIDIITLSREDLQMHFSAGELRYLKVSHLEQEKLVQMLAHLVVCNDCIEKYLNALERHDLPEANTFLQDQKELALFLLFEKKSHGFQASVAFAVVFACICVWVYPLLYPIISESYYSPKNVQKSIENTTSFIDRETTHMVENIFEYRIQPAASEKYSLIREKWCNIRLSFETTMQEQRKKIDKFN